MSKPLTCVLIGCGRIAANHLIACERNADRLRLVAVCDLIPERMGAVLAKRGLEKEASIARYQDYRKMLDEQRPDFAAIATESGEHAAIALECIDRGIHVVIEKPIAMSMDDAEAIIERAKRRNVKVAACHQNRFNVAIQELRGALDGGRFGRLSHGSIHVRWNRDRNYYSQAPWRGTWAQDGGCLMNQCIHGIDLLRWTFGEPYEVYGTTRQRFHNYLEAEDVGLAVVKFKNGAICTIEGTVNVYPRNLEETLCVFGEKGTVKIGGKSTNTIDVWDFLDEMETDEKKRGLVEQTSNVYGNGHALLYQDMIEAICEDRAPYVDAEAGRGALELVLAIYKSQQSGQPVRLPLRDFGSAAMSSEDLVARVPG